MKPPYRHVVIGVLSVAAIYAALLLARMENPSPPVPLSLAVAENLLDIPVFVATEKGFFKEEGLDIHPMSFIAGKEGLEALLRGDADVAVVAETPLVLKSFQHPDFVILASLNYSFANSRIIARREAGIRSVQDLRGRRVGILKGTSSHYVLDAQLEDQGLGSADVIEVPMSPSEMGSRLAAKQVDAIAAFEPVAYQAFRVLGDDALDITVPGRVRETFNYVSKPDVVLKQSVALTRLFRATQRAEFWLREHRSEAISLVATRLKLDPKIVAALWDNYHPGLTLDQNLLLSLEAQARWAAASGLAKGQPPNFLQLLDWSPLERVDPPAVTVIH